MFVARLVSKNGKIMGERVLDTIIERKNVEDLQSCLITKSKNYKPVSSFKIQMYRLQHCGIDNKLFLIEGDEEDPTQFMMYSSRTEYEASGTKAKAKEKTKGQTKANYAPEKEQLNRYKRVKTARLQVNNPSQENYGLHVTF